ncbi:hypothetical protein HK097_001743, partial [Rhizophlyctis rosea]
MPIVASFIPSNGESFTLGSPNTTSFQICGLLKLTNVGLKVPPTSYTKYKNIYSATVTLKIYMSSRISRQQGENRRIYRQRINLFSQTMKLVDAPSRQSNGAATDASGRPQATGASTIDPIPPNDSIHLPFNFHPQPPSIPFQSSTDFKFNKFSTSVRFKMRYKLYATVVVPRKHFQDNHMHTKTPLTVKCLSPHLLTYSFDNPQPAGWMASIPQNLTLTRTTTPATPFLLDFTLLNGPIIHPNLPAPIYFRIIPNPSANTTPPKVTSLRIRIKQYTTVRANKQKAMDKENLVVLDVRQVVNGEFWKGRDLEVRIVGEGGGG